MAGLADGGATVNHTGPKQRLSKSLPLRPARPHPATDPADLAPYTRSDGIIYHGNGEPDFEGTAEATAHDIDPREDCNGRAL